MKKIMLLVLVSTFAMASDSEFPSHVKKIDSKPNAVVSVRGNLSQGKKVNDLSWAWKSSVACFPGTQKKKFTGNHVLYSTNLPSRAKMWITVIPDNKNANMSIYAYSIGKRNFSTVPNLRSCVSCEAEHKWDYKKRGRTQDHTRTVYLNAIRNPYNVVIGVAGAHGLARGGYRLQVKIEGGEDRAALNQAQVRTIPVSVRKNSVTTLKGNLERGVVINDLSWAWRSSVACFPGTQKKKFTGNHVLYTTGIPPYSEMEITVVPDDKNADFSIYAYQVGTRSNAIVPKLYSCVSCEAEHKWDYKKRGRTQDHTRTVKLNAIRNPYKVVIGVVGANGLKRGGYKLRIKLKSR